MNSFFREQTHEEQDLYIELVKTMGKLSRLYNESDIPYLYYRSMENIFCKSFNATDLSRSDISADASKNGMGIGLKTFLQNNKRTFQKIAEFNKDSYLFRDLDNVKKIKMVSELRNERINTTMRLADVNEMIYHCITRDPGKMYIYEENMDLINIDKIKIIGVKNSNVHFMDDLNDYSFSITKSTLLKRFDVNHMNYIDSFDIQIMDDPFNFLLNLFKDKDLEKTLTPVVNKQNNQFIDFIVLPLYSVQTGDVKSKSGLNMWNASGRPRNVNEVYIPIPKWIHKKKPNFFVYRNTDNNTNSFNVKLPNNKTLSMKVTQAGGKALQSDPNKALGEWILRDVLNIPVNVIVTKMMLDTIGIDSVMLSKIDDSNYVLDFLDSGSYDEFEQEFK